MKDAQAIAFLIARQPAADDLPWGHTGQTAALAGVLGIEAPTLSMWKSRRIPNLMRPRVLALLRQYGVKLPDTWAYPVIVKPKGNTNGRQKKARRKAKQQGVAKKGRRRRAKEVEARP